MKDSGIEWIGDVPEHWGTPFVGQVYHIQLGKMLQPNRMSDDDVLVPYLKADNVQWENVKILNLPKMWADFNEVTKYRVVKGDLVVCEGGEGGRSAILNVSIDNCIIQNAIHRVRNSKNSEIGYLLYLLRVCSSSGWLNAISNKATIQHFTRNKLSSLKIPLPPRDEQKQIADFLGKKTSKIDSDIQENQKLIELLKEKRQAIINLVTKGLDPTVPMKDSGMEWIGKIPEHWKIRPIGKVCKSFVPGRYKPQIFDGEIPWITTEDLGFDHVSKSKKGLGLSLKEIKEFGTKIIPPNSVIMTCVGELGRTSITLNEIVINQQLHGFQPVLDIMPYYLAKVIQSQQDFLSDIANTTVIKYLNKENCESILIPIPPLDEQKQIADFIINENKKIDSIIRKTESQIEKLREFRQAIISEVVTGKIDVRETQTIIQ